MSFQGSTSLKFFKRLNVYKNSTGTVEFDPANNQGRSYRWTFLAPVDGVLVFNEYRWSNTTSGHQSAVMSTLDQLGRKYIVADFGQTSPLLLNRSHVEHLYLEAFRLENEADLARQQNTWTNQDRKNQAKRKIETAKKLESISKRFKVTQKRLNELKKQADEEAHNSINEEYSEKCFKALSLKRAALDLNVETAI